MAWAGSCQDRGNQAAGAALALGATPLEALIVGDSASYGDVCWVTDASQAKAIVQKNGRNPHPRSVARARRNVTAKGLLQYRRIMPGHRPPGAKYRSTGGTTAKTVDFSFLSVRDPLTRAERRRLHKRRKKLERAVSPEVRQQAAQSNAPSHVSGAAAAAVLSPNAAQVTADPELASLIASVGANLTARWEAEERREDAAMLKTVPRPPRPPPDG